MINAIFDLCVQLLLFMAEHAGMTYKAINVWIFVIIWPIFTLLLIAIIIRQQVKIRRLSRVEKGVDAMEPQTDEKKTILGAMVERIRKI